MSSIGARSWGLTRSSASNDRTHGCVAWARAKFFWAAKPAQGLTKTLAVNFWAISTVRSVLSASTITISWAQATLSRQFWIPSSSLWVMMVTEIPATISPTPFPAYWVSEQPLDGHLKDRAHPDVLHRLRRALNRPDPRAIWTVLLGSGWPVEADGRHAQRRRHMQRTGIVANRQVRPVQERRKI